MPNDRMNFLSGRPAINLTEVPHVLTAAFLIAPPRFTSPFPTSLGLTKAVLDMPNDRMNFLSAMLRILTKGCMSPLKPSLNDAKNLILPDLSLANTGMNLVLTSKFPMGATTESRPAPKSLPVFSAILAFAAMAFECAS